MSELTRPQRRRRDELIQLVTEWFTGWDETGRALRELRDSEYYIETHETFEAFCKEHWGISRARAYQLIDSCKSAETVSTTVDTDKLFFDINERQMRELNPLETDQEKADVFARAVEIAPKTKDGKAKVTAKVIVEARNEVIGETKPSGNGKPKKSEPPKASRKQEIRDAAKTIAGHHGEVIRLLDHLANLTNTNREFREAAISKCHDFLAAAEAMRDSYNG